MPAAWLIERSIITPREEVEAAVYGVTSAFQQKRIDDTLEYISPRSLAIRGLVLAALNVVTVHDDLRVTDVQVELLAQSSRARSHFRANGTVEVGQWGRRFEPSRWNVTWQKEGQRWRIIEIQQLDPIRDEEIHLWESIGRLR